MHAARRRTAPTVSRYVARLAAVYHFKLCRAILVGLRRQLDRDGRTKPGEIGMLDTIGTGTILSTKFPGSLFVRMALYSMYRVGMIIAMT